MANITKSFVDRTNEPGEYRDDSLKGFFLDIGNGGAKSYRFQARIKGGKKATITIGQHGDKDSDGNSWTADRARAAAEVIRGKMRDGTDPRAAGEQQKREHQERAAERKEEVFISTLTLRKVFLEWSNQAAKNKESTKTLYRQCIFKHLKEWLDEPIANITPESVRARYQVVANETEASAGNTFRALRRLCSWIIADCEDKGIAPPFVTNPVSTLARRKDWKKPKARKRVITDSELKPWFDTVLSLQNKNYCDYLIFTLLTGLRKSESGGLKWINVDFNLGQFTVEDTKNREAHSLPLTPFTAALLRSRERDKINSEFVFPSNAKSGHIDDLRDCQDKIKDASGVEVTLHDLRRTFSFVAARIGLGNSPRKALLNHHSKNDVLDQHYTPWDVEQLKAPLMQIEAYLLKQAGVDPLPAIADHQKIKRGKVVPIRAARR